MNYSQTVRDILANGGVTEALNGARPFFGYAYALDCCEERMAAARFNAHALADYVRRHKSELTRPGRYLGAWLDGEDVYLDVSRVSLDKEDAMTQAARYGQESVYDVETRLTLTVPEHALA